MKYKLRLKVTSLLTAAKSATFHLQSVQQGAKKECTEKQLLIDWPEWNKGETA